jgi:hypothetical protein
MSGLLVDRRWLLGGALAIALPVNAAQGVSPAPVAGRTYHRRALARGAAARSMALRPSLG